MCSVDKDTPFFHTKVCDFWKEDLILLIQKTLAIVDDLKIKCTQSNSFLHASHKVTFTPERAQWVYFWFGGILPLTLHWRQWQKEEKKKTKPAENWMQTFHKYTKRKYLEEKTHPEPHKAQRCKNYLGQQIGWHCCTLNYPCDLKWKPSYRHWMHIKHLSFSSYNLIITPTTLSGKSLPSTLNMLMNQDFIYSLIQLAQIYK